MSYEFQPGEYKTRDGRDAIICTTDAPQGRPLLGLLKQSGNWSAARWFVNGQMFHDEENGLDLMPPKRAWYFNVYADGYVSARCASRAEADAYSSNPADARFACVRVTEGQFDE